MEIKMKLQHKTLRIILGTVITVLIIAGLILALPWIWGAVLYLIKLFMPFILAFVFALAVNPLARYLEKHLKIPRTASALIVIILLIGGLGTLISWAVYKVVNELREMYFQIPEIYADALSWIELLKDRLSGIYEMLPGNIQLSMTQLSDNLSAAAADFINTYSLPVVLSAGNIATSLPSMLISVIVFLLSSFFMISDFDRVQAFVKKPLSHHTKERISLLSSQLKKYLGGYVKAQVIIMTVVFFVLFIGLSILDVNFALLIALGIAIFDALPFFGSGAVLWPWSIVSFIMGDFKMGIAAIVIYVIIIITRQLIEPKIVSKNIGMNPILTLMSMYLGFKVLSIGGMILGPIIMMLIVSLYKAEVFEKPIALVRTGVDFIKRKGHESIKQLIKFWESE